MCGARTPDSNDNIWILNAQNRNETEKLKYSHDRWTGYALPYCRHVWQQNSSEFEISRLNYFFGLTSKMRIRLWMNEARIKVTKQTTTLWSKESQLRSPNKERFSRMRKKKKKTIGIWVYLLEYGSAYWRNDKRAGKKCEWRDIH